MHGNTYSIPDLTGNKFALIFVTKNDFVDNQSFLFSSEKEVNQPRMWTRKIAAGNIDIYNNPDMMRSTLLQPTDPCIVTCVYNGVDTYIGVNGAYNRNTSTSKTFDGENVTSMHFGTNEISQQSINGFYGEFCTMLNASEADIQRAEGYFAHKWGLVSSLDANHPYKNAPPAV